MARHKDPPDTLMNSPQEFDELLSKEWSALEQFQRGENRYDQGEYAEVGALLDEYIERAKAGEGSGPQGEPNLPRLKQAYVFKGIAEFLLDHKPEAFNSFQELLELDPEYQMDPLFVAPQIIEEFNEQRATAPAPQTPLDRLDESEGENLMELRKQESPIQGPTQDEALEELLGKYKDPII